MNKITNIIVVKYNVPSVEKKCIASILEHTDGQKTPYDLIVIDNYPEQRDYSLSKVWNDYIKNSNADYFCVLNSDAYAENGWLEKMLEVFDKEDKVGIVGPTSNKVGGQQGRIKTSKEYAVTDTKYICGLCMLFPKKIWEMTGGFEERFRFSSEDNYFSWQVQQLGYRTLVRHDVFIYHDFHASWGEAKKRGRNVRSGDCKEAEKIFRELTKGKAERPDGRPSNINEK